MHTVFRSRPQRDGLQIAILNVLGDRLTPVVGRHHVVVVRIGRVRPKTASSPQLVCVGRRPISPVNHQNAVLFRAPGSAVFGRLRCGYRQRRWGYWWSPLPLFGAYSFITASADRQPYLNDFFFKFLFYIIRMIIYFSIIFTIMLFSFAPRNNVPLKSFMWISNENLNYYFPFKCHYVLWNRLNFCDFILIYISFFSFSFIVYNMYYIDYNCIIHLGWFCYTFLHFGIYNTYF